MMREICVIFLFVLITVTSSAHVKFYESGNVSANEKRTAAVVGDDDNENNLIEIEFLKNLTQIMSSVEGRNKSGSKKKGIKSPQIPPVTSDPVQQVTSRIPCNCTSGVCSCCVGGFFFNNKGCMKLKYMPEDFAFEFRMMFNDRTLYKNTVSGKNPRPICVSPPRFDNWIEMCARFHDIYFVGRNMHVCLDVSATLGEFDLLDRQFDCMKFGSDGVALVSPEEGGGHPGYPPVINAGTDAEIDAGGVDEIEDYDEVVG